MDPRDAQILTLTTALEKQPVNKPQGFGGYGGANEETIPGMKSLKKWRTINKGPTLAKDGVTHHWCKHHVYEGCYDGLYYHNHTEASHEKWAAKKRVGQAEKTTGPAPAAPTPAVEPNLKISDALKNALCTNFCISKEDLAKVVNESVN